MAMKCTFFGRPGPSRSHHGMSTKASLDASGALSGLQERIGRSFELAGVSQLPGFRGFDPCRR